MTTQERIRQALDDLATAPEPVGLADRALRAARRRHAMTVGAGIGAGGLALALAAVAVIQLPGGRPAQPGAAEPCVTFTSGSNGLSEVPRDQWPDFVSATVAALPARSDYSMQSGHTFCFGFPGQTEAPGYTPAPDAGVGSAYAVVDLGMDGEDGRLSIDIQIGVPTPPVDCEAEVTEFNARAADVFGEGAAENGLPTAVLLLCHEPTPTTPLTYVLGFGDDSMAATAAYDDGTVVELSYSGGDAITAEQLAAAAADPGLYATIPSAPAATAT